MKYFSKISLKNSKECILRNAEEADGKDVLELFIKTHEETNNLLSLPEEIKFTVEEQCAYCKEKAESENEIEIIAIADGRIVGSAGIEQAGNHIKTRHRAEFGISVLKEYWGLGIGRALTEACIECAKKAGFKQLELEVVDDNQSAIKLYKSVGFTEYGRKPRAFLHPEIGYQTLVLMRMELD